MNKREACKALMESFIRMVSKYNALEKYPLRYGTEHEFYHSERHMIDLFGDHPAKNVTELASLAGVTKGAVSQVASKLERKGAVRRVGSEASEKEVLIKLTAQGKRIYERHQKANEETVSRLYGELKKHRKDKVDFLLSMFHWFEDYLDESRQRMEAHGGRGH